jgi:hypothetical protein
MDGADGREDADQLVLTPAKLRMHSSVVAVYATGTWLMHSIFIVLLFLKVSSQGRLEAVERSAFDRALLLLLPLPLLHRGPRPRHAALRPCMRHSMAFMHPCVQVEGLLYLPWWAVFVPEWAVHLVQLPLFTAVIARRVSMSGSVYLAHATS